MARSIWKGHISFGLVNIPVTLYSAETRQDISLKLLDSRNNARVKYERVNEETGEEVPWNAIVKGFEYDKGQYVLLSSEEMERVKVEATKTIEIEDFVDVEEIDPVYFDKPYYIEPGKKGEKSYALLRETLRATNKAGVAQVVIRSREYLSLLMVRDDCLVLNLLRYKQELRDAGELNLPAADDPNITFTKREIDMATRLVEEMTAEWDPARYHDEYRESLMAYIEDKVKRGELSISEVTEGEDEEAEEETVVDLMAYLKQSVDAAKKRSSDGESKKKKPSAKKATKKAAKKSSKKSA